MPMLLGTKGSDILQWRASAELLAELKGELNRRWELSPTGPAESFLEQFIGALDDELSFEKRLASETETLSRELAAGSAPAQLLGSTSRFRDSVATHFKRRRSVLALCELLNGLHDKLLARAVELAGERMLKLGQGSPSGFALLVSGDRGRGETTLKSENRYYLLHEEHAPRFPLFQRQLSAVLQELGILAPERPLWYGTLKDWQALLHPSAVPAPAPPQEEFLAALPPFATPLATEPPAPADAEALLALADLAFLSGSEQLAAQALDAAQAALLSDCHSEPFQQLARRSMALPLAAGRFGRWRLERKGEQRAKLNLRQYALDPLVEVLRVLALQAGLARGGSLTRLHFLLERGILDVELAGRLLQGYQCIMQLKILLEIRDEAGGLYLNPEEFSQETEARFKSALEALLGLQKIGYQLLIGPA